MVVTTVGRPEAFERLLAALDEAPDVADLELVVVDQSTDRSCLAVLDRHGSRATVRATTSGRGASVGRNVGLALVTAPVVGFPDDNAWFPPETPGRVIDAFGEDPTLTGLSIRQATPDGRDSMLRWQREPGPVTESNFMHTSIMSGMFFAKDRLDAVGRFDEGMGVGSDGWYGSGEESDLLLRVLRAGCRITYDPSIVVWQEETRDDTDPRFAEKMLRYGAGAGHLWRRHDLSRRLLAYYAARKVVGVGVRTLQGRRQLAAADVQYLRGLVGGYLDRRPRGLRGP